MGYLPFMPRAMELRARTEWAELNGVRYYTLDAADLDRNNAVYARAQAGADTFLWYWFRPDVAPRVGERWDRKPGLPFVQPPHAGEKLVLNGDRYEVLRSVRIRLDNYGWAVMKRV